MTNATIFAVILKYFHYLQKLNNFDDYTGSVLVYVYIILEYLLDIYYYYNLYIFIILWHILLLCK